MDVDKRVLEFVRIRDKIKKMEAEFEQKLAPYKKARDGLAMLLLNELNTSKVESMRTIHGTLYKKHHESASIQDKEAFWNFVIENSLWELVDKRANAKACADYAKENKSLPPGINYSNFYTASVRKA